tara:strand:+ start:264 stop:509 length:246 start_codon:yes stop_codon:yes gene_type:complete
MWREQIDPKIKEHFEELIRRVSLERKSYENSSHPSKTQLWLALAVLSKDISDLHLRLDRLEKKGKKPSARSKKVKKSLEKF